LSRDTQIAKQQQSFIEKVGKYTAQGKGIVGSGQGGIRAAPVAQEGQCLGLDGYLYTTRGEQREEICVVLKVKWLLVIDRLIDCT
jgi:hypothetical protein